MSEDDHGNEEKYDCETATDATVTVQESAINNRLSILSWVAKDSFNNQVANDNFTTGPGYPLYTVKGRHNDSIYFQHENGTWMGLEPTVKTSVALKEFVAHEVPLPPPTTPEKWSDWRMTTHA
jgi:hypothetical protein